MSVIFDSKDIIVRGQNKGGTVSFITFSHIDSPSDQGYAEGFLASRGFNYVLVSAKWNHWWQVDDMPIAMGKVNSFIADLGRQRVVSYGSSMGGFGALLAARWTAVHAVVALSPQTTCRRTDIPTDHRWSHLWEQIASMPFEIGIPQPQDAYPEIYVFYDPCCQDNAHVQFLEQRLQFKAVPLVLGEHSVANSLSESSMLSGLIASIVSGNYNSFSTLSDWRYARRKTVNYALSLIGRGKINQRSSLHGSLIAIIFDRLSSNDKFLFHELLDHGKSINAFGFFARKILSCEQIKIILNHVIERWHKYTCKEKQILIRGFKNSYYDNLFNKETVIFFYNASKLQSMHETTKQIELCWKARNPFIELTPP